MNQYKLRSRTFILIIVIILAACLAVFLFNKIVEGRPNFIENCSEAKVRHITNIPKSSVYYRPSLDRNHDGVACQT